MKNKILGRVLSAASAAALAAGGMATLPSAQIEASALSGLDAKGIVSQMKIGWNLGNTLDSWSDKLNSSASPETFATCWGNPAPNANQFQAVKDAGFNTVRIPTTWYQHLEDRGNGKYHVNDQWMAYVKKTVDYAIDRDMFVILNIHHENFIDRGGWNQQTYNEAEAKLTSIWSEVAEEFKNYDQHLIFEGMNEPRQKGTDMEWGNGGNDGGYSWQYINDLNAAFVRTVRGQGSSQNKERLLMLPGYCASSDYDAISHIAIPANAGNVALSVHAYAPYFFTMDKSDKANHSFPGQSGWGEDYESALSSMFSYFGSLQSQKGAPIIIGEFSASDFNNTEDRVRWAKSYLSKAKENGIPCVLWDNNVIGKSDGEAHGYLNRNSCTWYDVSKPVIDAMMDVYKNGSGSETNPIWSKVSIGSNWIQIFKSNNGTALEAWKSTTVQGWKNFANDQYDFVLVYESSNEPKLVLQDANYTVWEYVSSSDYSDTPYIKKFSYNDITTAANRTGKSLNDLPNLFISATDASMTAYGLYAVPKNGSGPVVNTPENPTVSYTKGDFKVTLNWNAVNNSEGYGIYGYTGGTWKLLKEVGSGTTSYTISNLKSGTNYQVAVLTKYNGKYDNDFSKAITVTPNNVQVTPPSLMVMTNSKTGQFRAEWDKVQGATAYAIAYMPSSATSWKQIAAFNTKTFSYTSPSNGRTPKGTYKIAVAAKVGGKWYISDPCQVTIK